MTLKTSLKRFRSTGVLALLIALICIVFSLTTGGLFVTSMNIKNRRTRPLPMPSVCDLRSIFVSFVSMGNISSRLFSLGAGVIFLLDKAPQP